MNTILTTAMISGFQQPAKQADLGEDTAPATDAFSESDIQTDETMDRAKAAAMGADTEAVTNLYRIPKEAKKLLKDNDGVIWAGENFVPLNEKETVLIDLKPGQGYRVFLKENRPAGYQYEMTCDEEQFNVRDGYVSSEGFIGLPIGGVGTRIFAFEPQMEETPPLPVDFTYKKHYWDPGTVKTLNMLVSVGHPIVPLFE